MPLNEDSRILSDFRGMPYREKISRARSTGGAPMRSDKVVEKLMARISAKVKSKSSFETIVENWQKCVPPKFAGKSSPANMRAGILYACAQNPQVRQELQFSARSILKKINALDGCSAVKTLKFI